MKLNLQFNDLLHLKSFLCLSNEMNKAVDYSSLFCTLLLFCNLEMDSFTHSRKLCK